MSGNRNLFAVFTEYHLLLALSIIYDRFNTSSDKNTILLIHKSDRLRGLRVDQGVETVRFMSVELPDVESVSGVLQDICGESFRNLFVFHEYEVISSYLLSRLRCRKNLVEDGTAIYQHIDRSAWPSRLRATWQAYKDMRRLRIVHVGFGIVSNEHGLKKSVDAIWLTNPALYRAPHKTGKELVAIDLLSSPDKVAFTSTYFVGAQHLKVLSEVVFFIGRVSYGEAYLEKEMETLQRVSEKYPEHPFLIKPHPLSPRAQVDRYRTLRNVTLITEKLPAELFMAYLKNAIIVAVDSTSMFYNNGSAQYSILYPYLQEQGVYPRWRHIPFPSHVHPWNAA